MASPFVATRRLFAPVRAPRGPQSVAEALRRNELARRQAVRRKERRQQKEQADTERDLRLQKDRQNSLKSKQTRLARQTRKEDYELGPLAPRRDVGMQETTYGTLNTAILQPIEVPKWRRKWCPFKPGDRVVLLEGKDKGKITVVSQIEEESQAVVVKDLNMVDAATPEWLKQEGQSDTRLYPQPLPFESLRLVYPMPHPVTGQERDVIIEKLERRVDWHDEATNITHYKRVIPELDDHEVPWPPEDTPVYSAHEDDSVRIQTEQVTFEGQALQLLGAPMPPSVIDELRNKHSKLSMRRLQDPAYLYKLRQREEASRQAKLDMMVAMRTPLQELHALQASQRNQVTRQMGSAHTDEPTRTFLDIQEGKPWRRRITQEAAEAWKAQWEQEKKLAKEAGRKAKKPLKLPRKEEELDPAFLEQLGALMVEKGLDKRAEAVRRPSVA